MQTLRVLKPILKDRTSKT